jgi:4-hydroxy-tetrahydrodipicolinate reductase
MKLGIYGYGKMGKAINNLIDQFDEIDSVEHYSLESKDLESFILNNDVILDFSTAQATDILLDYMINKNIFPKSILIGTTALSDKAYANMKLLSEKSAILYSSNVSIGANIQAFLANKLAQIFGNDYEIDIIDLHHSEKKDAPSGTAFMIADSINKGIKSKTGNIYKIVTDRSANPERKKQEISICSVRAGSIPGTHEVLFSGKYDSIKLTHRVEKRELLANAAIKVGIWLSSQAKGIYTMNDFIKFD